MRALILAAGRGSRLGELTKDRPKCLMKLAGKTLIEWQLQAFTGSGIRDVAIVRGYQAASLGFTHATFYENMKWETTNMVSSLLCANEWLNQDNCIVSYADILYPKETVNMLAEAEGEICITYNLDWWEVWKQRFENPLDDAETFRVDSDRNITEIGGKTQNPDDIQGQYMGLLKFSPHGWATIKDYLSTLREGEISKLDMTSLLNRLIRVGIIVKGIPIKGMWYEVDNETDLNTYSRLISEGRSWMNNLIK